MAMNKQRRTSNLNNIVRYDTSGNVSLPAGLTVEGLDAGFVKSDANGLFSIDTGAYLPTPSQSGNAGKYLTTDGSVLSWGTVPSVNIYNSNGTLTGNRVVTMGSYTLSFDKDILVNGLTIGRGKNQDITNTAVGAGALGANTEVNNTAFGYAALQNVTTGGQNTALGRAAGASNVTGYHNTYVGLNSGIYATSGGNTMVGTATGAKLTTGGGNIFIGYQTGFDIITGSQNTIIGNQIYADALPSNTSNNIILADGIGAIRIRAFNTGNVIINGSVDAGFKLDVIGTVRLYPRGAINGGFEFTFNDVYNIMHSGSHTYLSANQTMMVGAGNNSFTFIGVNKDDYITPVLVGYNSWQSNISSASAILDVRSTTRGFLQPRMTTTQRDAITTPATGLSVYNTTTNTSDFYNGSSWISGGINIYNSDGTLTGNRTVTMGSFTLSFEKDIKVNGLTIGKGNNQDVSNTAVGFGSLGASTTGLNNTAVGVYTLGGNTTGVQNTVVGSGAGANNTGGTHNVYVGFSAGVNGTVAFRNTVIGTEAGQNLTSGGYNIFVGYQTGSGVTTGSNNTIIGSQITGLAATFSNNIILADGQGNIRIRAFDTGNVTIGGSTDSGYKLDVQGTARVTGNVTLSTTGGSQKIRFEDGVYIEDGAAGGRNVQIGNSSGAAPKGTRNVAIGNDPTYTTAGYQVVIGQATSRAANGIAIGLSASAGLSSFAVNNAYAHDYSVAIATQYGTTTTASYQFVVEATDWYIRHPALTGQSGTAGAINGTGANGTDFAGGNITIAGGKGTGTGTPGDVIISTATATSSGTTLQSLTQRVWIKGENGNVGIGASPNASYKLDVAGTGRFTNMLSVITTGTTNDVALFKSTEPYITVEAAGGSNSASIFLKPSTSSQNGTIQNRTGGGIEFYTGATPSLNASIKASGAFVVSSTLGYNGVEDSVKSAVYTPTLTDVSNITSSSVSSNAFRYIRVGNIVYVSGRITVSATSANTATEVEISLPIASNLANSIDLSGVATTPSNGYGQVIGDVTADTASFYVFPTSAGSSPWNVEFSYIIK